MGWMLEPKQGEGALCMGTEAAAHADKESVNSERAAGSQVI